MTIRPRHHDALAAASHTSSFQAASERPAATAARALMAPLALTPLAPPRSTASDSSAAQSRNDILPGTAPTVRRDLLDRLHQGLLNQLGRHDLSAYPPSWAGISDRLTQEEATAVKFTLMLITESRLP